MRVQSVTDAAIGTGTNQLPWGWQPIRDLRQGIEKLSVTLVRNQVSDDQNYERVVGNTESPADILPSHSRFHRLRVNAVIYQAKSIHGNICFRTKLVEHGIRIAHDCGHLLVEVSLELGD